MDKPFEWEVGDRLIAKSGAAKTGNYEGSIVTKKWKDDYERYEITRPDGDVTSGLLPESMTENFDLDWSSRVTDEQVEKARQELKKLLD